MKRFGALFAITLPPSILYLYTMLPHIGFAADTTKFQYVGYTLSTTHETGYPIYTVLTFLFTRLVWFGQISWRANLFSAVCTILVLLVSYALLRRLAVRRTAALVAVLFLSITPTLWQYALVAEVYTLNLLFVAATLYCLVSWRETGRDRWFYAFALVYALSFGNHMSMILLLPAIIFYVCAHNWRVLLQPRKIAWVLGCVALGASTYLYIYWRSIDPATPYLEASITDWQSFVRTVTGQRFQGMMFAYSAEQLAAERIPQFQAIFVKELKLFWLLAAFGLLALRDWRVWAACVLLLVTYTGFNLNYAIPDINPYLIPGFWACVLLIAFALNWLLAKISWRKGRHLLVMLLLFGTVWQMARSYPFVNQNGNIWGAPPIEDVFRTIDDDSVLILPNVFEAHMVWYFLYAEGYADRNIYAVFDDGHLLSPGHAVGYLNGNGDLQSLFVDAPPRGLNLYCYSAFENCDRYTGAADLLHDDLYPHLFTLTRP